MVCQWTIDKGSWQEGCCLLPSCFAVLLTSLTLRLIKVCVSYASHDGASPRKMHFDDKKANYELAQAAMQQMASKAIFIEPKHTSGPDDGHNSDFMHTNASFQDTPPNAAPEEQATACNMPMEGIHLLVSTPRQESTLAFLCLLAWHSAMHIQRRRSMPTSDNQMQ